ncbi:MAG: hypothetical protein RL701_4043 [Pseudomonadota bacterium]|jgi:hypothetical protein
MNATGVQNRTRFDTKTHRAGVGVKLQWLRWALGKNRTQSHATGRHILPFSSLVCDPP